MPTGKDWQNFLREHFPAGTRIRLRTAVQDYPITPGTSGTLRDVDASGNFQVEWDSGENITLPFNAGSFAVLPPEPELLKIYMPLSADLLYLDQEEYERYGDKEYQDGPVLRGAELVEYRDVITATVKDYQTPEEPKQAVRGVMAWYNKEDGVNDKVRSAVFDVECRDGKLWGVVQCQVIGNLTPEELKSLKSYLSGQAADGVGEGIEQQDIDVGGDIINVHFWQSDNSWFIRTEAECFPPPAVEETLSQAGTLRFYMPVNAELYAGEEPDERPEELSGYDLVYYTDEITQALERQKMPEEAQRGIMCWYGENDSVDQKVESVFLNIECRERNVWCVAECQLKEPLTPAEIDSLKSYITAQLSDGVGESVESHAIQLDAGDLYVHLWDSGSDWSIRTEQERFPASAAKEQPGMSKKPSRQPLR